MRPVRWFLNVVPRTLRAFVPALARPDDPFAREVLRPEEFALYLRMDPRDRHHGVAVARAVLARDPGAESVVLRAAILHDVGKSVAPYRAWERIAVHVLVPASRRPRRGALGDALRRHLEHAERGAELIRAAGGDARVADLVARHHHSDPEPHLALLRAADEAT